MSPQLPDMLPLIDWYSVQHCSEWRDDGRVNFEILKQTFPDAEIFSASHFFASGPNTSDEVRFYLVGQSVPVLSGQIWMLAPEAFSFEEPLLFKPGELYATMPARSCVAVGAMFRAGRFLQPEVMQPVP